MTIPERPPGGENPYGLTGLRYMLDVHMLDRGGVWGDRLRFLAHKQWLWPHYCDTALVEIGATQDPATADRLHALLGGQVITMGVAVADHSLSDLSLAGTDADQERLATVYGTLWDNDMNSDASTDGSRTGRTRFRDAMHVATAIRNCFDAFVTDDQRMLRRADDVRAAFPDFQLLAPRAAVLKCASRLTAVRRRYEVRGWEYALPAWPTEGEIGAWNGEES